MIRRGLRWGFRLSKYGAKQTVVDGIIFASRAEARRYTQLKLLCKAGQITGLTLQPRFPLRVEGQLICTYVGDFRYVERGKEVCEDVKGFKTRDYKLKRKLLLAIFPTLDHREIA